MGGVWERQIRSVRNVLASLLESHGTQLDDESLRTFMIEAEAIVNCRPLAVNTINSSQYPEPLTPNHLLTMKSKVVMPPPGHFQRTDLYLNKRWRRVQYLANEFWMEKGVCTVVTAKAKMDRSQKKPTSERYCDCNG